MTRRHGREGSRARGASELRDLLHGYLGRKGPGRRIRAGRELAEAWVAAAGPEVAAHTRTRSLRRGVLTVEVDSGPLCHELAGFRTEELLVALKQRLRDTEVSAIRFRIGTLS